jgi:hypothetical protein
MNNNNTRRKQKGRDRRRRKKNREFPRTLADKNTCIPFARP